MPTRFRWNPATLPRCSTSIGAGVVTHIWFTIDSRDPHHLKNLVLRAWWDRRIVAFHRSAHRRFLRPWPGRILPLSICADRGGAPQKALNAYFKMPFASAAKITLTNEGPERTNSLYYAVDYVALSALPDDVGTLPRAVSPGRAVQGMDRRLGEATAIRW